MQRILDWRDDGEYETIFTWFTQLLTSRAKNHDESPMLKPYCTRNNLMTAYNVVLGEAATK